MIYLASDHGGFDLKKLVFRYLNTQKFSIDDVGAFEKIPGDDFADFVIPAIKRIQEDLENNKGIFICRNGVGVCVLANKFKGIRAGLSWNTKHAASLRNDDDTNVLTLPADYISEQNALEIILTWLKTPFNTDVRFSRRLENISEAEKGLN